MRLYHGASFEEATSWTGPLVATIDDVAVKLRWTETPYIWHTNTGQEIFVVLDGVVDMHVRTESGENVIALETGDVFHVEEGDEHVAHPRGPARILVVERADSV